MEGFIIKSISGDFHVYSIDDKKTYVCKVRGQIRNKNITPVCGDMVTFSYDEDAKFSIITDIKERKNKLVRPPIANVDIALIVMSCYKPSFDSYLVDKLITAASLEFITPVIILSKCEYLDDEVDSLLKNYEQAGYQVIRTSSKQNINIDKVKEIIKDKKVVLCGQSAVGKSSLINALLEDDKRTIGDFSEKLGRGKHQTREVEYINVDGGFIADSPGFSSLDIKVELPIFARVFKDFDTIANSCRFQNCLHNNEPDCAIKKAVENGIIDKRRYVNYLHLQSEIKDGKHVWKKK